MILTSILQSTDLPSSVAELFCQSELQHEPQASTRVCGGVCKPLAVSFTYPSTPLGLWTLTVHISGSTAQPSHACLSSASFVYSSPFQLLTVGGLTERQGLNLDRACHYQDHLRVKLLFALSYFFPLCDKPGTQTMAYSMCTLDHTIK